MSRARELIADMGSGSCVFLYLVSLLWGHTDFYLQVFNLSQFLLQLPHLPHLEKGRDSQRGARTQSQTAREAKQVNWVDCLYMFELQHRRYMNKSGRHLVAIWMDQTATSSCVPLSRRVAGCWQYNFFLYYCPCSDTTWTWRQMAITDRTIWFHNHNPHRDKGLIR